MITVHYESKKGTYSEIDAKFDSEELYFKCLPILEKDCLSKGFDIITETETEEEF
jgi:hypothetical protein